MPKGTLITMNTEHEDFLKRICDEVDRITEEYLPKDMSAEDIQVNVRLITNKDANPLGEHIRLIGTSIFVRLDSIKFDTPPLSPGQRSFNKGLDKFLGFETVWMHLEHMSSVAPGKDIEINGQLHHTCNVSVMEESLFRIVGTCEEFFDGIQDPIMEYVTQSSATTETSKDKGDEHP